MVEKRRIGIPDARVTQGILPDCVWEYPCVQEPCVSGSQCLQQGVDSFRCECDQLLCVKPEYPESYKVFISSFLLLNYCQPLPDCQKLAAMANSGCPLVRLKFRHP
jgi:chondroitin sulfate proteoglycan 4